MKFLIIALIVLLTSIEPRKNEQFKPTVVLELFTSQGCSSCPPADDLLNKIKEKYDATEVMALSYHVDYWNYIGWKDPFSQSKFSDLQRTYGRKFYNSSIYTPQMVINGQEHFVGSNEGVLKSKVNSYLLKDMENSITLFEVKKEGTNLSFNYTLEGNFSNKHLRVILIVDERKTLVSSGENKNRNLKNSNIVVQQSKINLKSKTGKGFIEIPQIVMPSDKLSLIILVETSTLDIVGAHNIKL